MTMIRTANESSVMTSLRELAKLEQDRVCEEERRVARVREDAVRADQERAETQRRTEAARAQAERETNACRAREEGEAEVRAEVRGRAAGEVACIEAMARTQLAEDNAARAHELAVLHAHAEWSGGRRARILGAALVLVLGGGAAAGFEAKCHLDAVARAGEELRDREATEHVAHARRALATLSALDRRAATLRSLRPGDDGWLSGAVAARHALDGASPDDERLDAFMAALDAAEASLAARVPVPPVAPVRQVTPARAPASPSRSARPPEVSPRPECRAGDPICGLSL